MKNSSSHFRIDGYFAETAYPSLFHQSFAPPWADAVLRQKGVVPPREADRAPFRMADLGCGDGMGLILLAAAYPEGQFIGIDAMPAHINSAKRGARRFGLSNLNFLCTTFSAAIGQSFAPFDYITAQGVIAWVHPIARAALYDFAGAHLAAHGVLTLGYNAMPGWSDAIPLQRMLLALGGTGKGKGAARYKAALTAIKSHVGIGASGISLARIEALEKLAAHVHEDYFPHEYFNENWQPLWSGDVIDNLGARSLAFTGTARFEVTRDDFCLRKAQREALATVKDEGTIEMLRDSFLGTSFRVDCFARAPRPAGRDVRMQGWIMAGAFADNTTYELVTPAGMLKFDNAAARAMITALSEGPARLCDCGSYSPADMLNAADALLAAGLILPTDPPQELSIASRALNTAIRDRRTGPHIAALIGRNGVISVSSPSELLLDGPTASALRRMGLTE